MRDAEAELTAPPAPVEKANPRRALGCLIEIAETLILTIVIFWGIQSFVAQPFQVQQQSMESTLLPGQYVLVDKLTPHLSTYSRGDIVVFQPVIREPSCDAPGQESSASDGTPFIKRVIGLPSDLVELRDGEVFVNGTRLSEEYVAGAETLPLSGQSTWTVPQGRLFLMGDNRMNSVDSRSDTIASVCIGDVIGRALLRYWPLSDFTFLARPDYDLRN
jgi:signal peptidase I